MSGFLSEGEAEEPFQITFFQFGVFFLEGKNLDIFEAIRDRNYGGERFQRGE